MTVFAAFFLLFFSMSCAKNGNGIESTTKLRDSLEKKIIARDFPIDSILHLLTSFEDSENNLGIYIASTELGNRYRTQSNFSKAIDFHRQSLNAAFLLKDTLSIAEAQNNIGTNLRRIGILPEASDYHYQALQISESYHDVNNEANQKNRVMALNGIGNIALTLNDFDEAESNFREALKGEVTINSNLGQAINYANIGAIFQKRRMYDSAFYYYELSMFKNQLIGSQLGIGLCHKHFGQIYEVQNKYAEAENEYRAAYNVMDGMEDRWHWLEACLAMARISLKQSRFDEAEIYLVKAKTTAEEIKSPEHLSETYSIYEMYFSRLGNFKNALESHKQSVMYHDSVQSIQKSNQVVETRINYEREKNLKYIDQLNREKSMQVRETKIILTSSVIALLLLISLSVALWYAFLQRTKKNKSLREIDRVKSNFFTNITHEFRTPLTIILGHSRQLQKKTDLPQKEEKSYLSAIEKQGEQMLRLVNQLLDIAKINVGMDNPVWKYGNIVTFIGILIDRYRLFANDKNIFISYYPQCPLIEMDFVPNYINNVFQNLLSNAINYSLKYGLVSVSVVPDNKTVKITVSDNGIGIDTDELERIFDLFYQVPSSENKQGSGIGLAYTKQLVERMNGTIEVKSQINEGSEFTVTLPIRTNEKVHIEKWEPGSESPHSIHNLADSKDEKAELILDKEVNTQIDGKPVILVVEDNKDVLFYMQSLLKDDYSVITAVDGVDAMEKAFRLVPDIIITDAMMPRKDGFSLCKEVKSSTILNHIPIIVVTAKTASEDMLAGLKCGADAYITKPFQPEELLIRVANLLELIKVMKAKYMKIVLEEKPKDHSDTNMTFLHNVTNLILNNISDPNLNPQQIADSLNISPSQLNRKVNALSGYSTSSYILQVKIDYSKKLLNKHEKNISEVGEACGFLDVAYFSRTFKKITGVTPSAYRKFPQ